MSSSQKTIKYIAIAFAIFLIVSIFSIIAQIGIGILRTTGVLSNPTNSNLDHYKYNTYIDINLKYTDLKIVEGSQLKVDNHNESVNVEINGNKLLITDNSNIFSNKNGNDVIVYVPYDVKFDIVNINTGAGRVVVNGFNTEELRMSLGAGETNISNILSNKTKISSGTGSLKITESRLNDAKLDLGIGSISIGGDITGDSKINTGIGEVTLNLDGAREDYTFDLNKGIGDIRINNRSVSDDEKIGNGRNRIKIDGGIGSIRVNTNSY